MELNDCRISVEAPPPEQTPAGVAHCAIPYANCEYD